MSYLMICSPRIYGKGGDRKRGVVDRGTEGSAPPSSFSPFLSRIEAGLLGLCFVGGSGRWRSRSLTRAGNRI